MMTATAKTPSAVKPMMMYSVGPARGEAHQMSHSSLRASFACIVGVYTSFVCHLCCTPCEKDILVHVDGLSFLLFGSKEPKKYADRTSIFVNGMIVRSPFRAKHHVVVQYMEGWMKYPLPFPLPNPSAPPPTPSPP